MGLGLIWLCSIPTVTLDFRASSPITRGIQPTMYRGRLWTMRQYAGFGTAAESNRRYRYLLSQGVSGLSVAFDLPTQIGYDSDHPLAAGEVGRVGVAIDSIDDMAVLFDGIPLDKVSTSMTINATAIILLALYVAVGKRQGVAPQKLSGTIQNDILKEYIARGTYIYPPRASLRIVTDIFAFCEREVPQWNTISISGYHIREAGSTAVQEVAFTLADAIAYVEAALDAGSTSTRSAAALVLLQRAQRLSRGGREVPRRAPAVGAHHARAIRRQESARAAAALPHADRRQHAHRAAAGQQHRPRRPAGAGRGASAARSRCTPTAATRRWRCRPRTRRASRCGRSRSSATRSGVANTVDPFAGSYCVEKLTNEIEAGAARAARAHRAVGGTLAAIEAGYIQRQIQESAYKAQIAIDRGDAVVVGVNRYVTDEAATIEVFAVDPELERSRCARAGGAARRDQAQWAAALAAVDASAQWQRQSLPAIIAAVEAQATVGEIADTLRRGIRRAQRSRAGLTRANFLEGV